MAMVSARVAPCAPGEATVASSVRARRWQVTHASIPSAAAICDRHQGYGFSGSGLKGNMGFRLELVNSQRPDDPMVLLVTTLPSL